jgi:hypothetical protein
MHRLSGFVIDQYDDVDGRVLRGLHPDPANIPEFIKTAARLEQEQINKVADDQFALVMLNEGRKMKKFAMVDRGNTALSVAYLLKQAHLLPREAVKIAAANLIEASRRFGLGIPEALEKAAETGMSPVSGKTQKSYAKGAKIIHLNFKGTEHASASVQKPTLGKHDAATADVQGRTNLDGVQGQNFMTFPAITEKEKIKQAGAFGDAEGEVRTRQRSYRYVDVTDWSPEEAIAEDHAPPQETLLGDKYPVDGMDQVKTAVDYFAENWKTFHPRDRREYCVKLAARLEKLGMAISEDVERYASPGYAADVDTHVESRRALVSEQFYPALSTLLEKRAMVSPDTFAEALAEFDNITEVRWLWDAQVCDPWKSTFGPSLEKIAAAEWTFSERGVRVHEGDLQELALNGLSLVKKQFGHDVAQEFAKKPKTVFESLPMPNKLVMARLAMAKHDGTATG